MPDSSSTARNPGIDLLRGLSIVLVVMHHAALRIPLEKGVLGEWLPERFLYGIQYDGFEAVFLFFVISGFLITSNSLGRWGTLAAIDAKAFYRRRAARIVPCLLALVAVLSVLALLGMPHYTMEQPKQTLAGAVLSALGFWVNVYQARTGWLPAGWGVLWSLSIEEVFYLAFPVACLLLARTRLLVPALALLALSIPLVRAGIHHDPIWAEKNYLQGMAAIATGVLAALLVARWPTVPRSTARWRQGKRALPAFAWLRSFGRLSYEVYLSHMFVVWLVVDRFDAAGADLHLGFLWFAPALAGSWALGWFVARSVSEPARRGLLRARASPANAPAGAGVRPEVAL